MASLRLPSTLALALLAAACAAPGGTPAATDSPSSRPARAPTPAAAVAGATAPTTVRIATFNVLNLFDNVDDPGKSDEGTAPKSDAELRVLASAIDALDADVVGVQEVENRAVLARLNRHLARPFGWVELLEGNDGRGIDCGILSRLPILSATSHRLMPLPGGDRSQRFARDFPVFRVAAGWGRQLDIGVVHLKSRRGENQSRGWRAAEARAIAAVIAQRRAAAPRVPFVLLGDFNDPREADTVRPLFERLVDATRLVPEEERYSYVYRGRPELIDYVLATPDVEIVAARFARPQDRPSDHSPLIADIDVGVPVERPAVQPGRAPAAPDPPLPPRLAATDLDGLERHLLSEVEVHGRVVKVYRPASRTSASLNFHDSYRRAVVGYVPAEALARMPDLDALVGRVVTLRGPVSRYRGALQIRITRPEQLVAGD